VRDFTGDVGRMRVLHVRIFMREQDPRGTSVGQIEKRRETMADGRRYMIYYTFGRLRDSDSADESEAQVTQAATTSEEPGNV
jgi:hypothetical protein